MKKKFAAHQIIVSEKQCYKQYVVELENRTVIRYFPLKEEIAFTEWIGGTIVLSPHIKEIELIQFPIKIDSLITTLTNIQNYKESAILYAWHISAEDTATGIVQFIKQL